MDILPAHLAVLAQTEKYFKGSWHDYLKDLKDYPDETTMTNKQALHIGIVAIMFGVVDRMAHFSPDALEEIETVVPALIDLPFVEGDDLPEIVKTFRKMLRYKFIRAEHPLEEWVAEMAWWAAFDESQYPPPIAMAGFIERVLQGRSVLDRFMVKGVED